MVICLGDIFQAFYHDLFFLPFYLKLDHKLQFFKGDTRQILIQLVKEHNIESIYVEEFFDQEEIDFFDKLKNTLSEKNVKLKIILGFASISKS